MAVLQSINVTFHTHPGDGKLADTILHIFIKNRSNTSSTPEGDTDFVANHIAFQYYNNLGVNVLNPYLGSSEFVMPGVAFAPGSSTTCPITLRAAPIQFEEIILPVVNVHILAASDNTWAFDYTVDFLFSDSTTNSFSSNSIVAPGFALDQDKRNHSGICAEMPGAPLPAPNQPMDPVLTQISIDFWTNGDSKESTTSVSLQIVNRVSATQIHNILSPGVIFPNEQFDDQSLKTIVLAPSSTAAPIRLQDIVLPVVHIVIVPTGADTWKFDYRVRFWFNNGSAPLALLYSSTTSGVVLNKQQFMHAGVYQGNSFPVSAPVAAQLTGGAVGVQVKPISLDFVNKKLNDFINNRQGVDPASSTPALIKLRLHNSGVVGTATPTSYYDLQTLDIDGPPPGFISGPTYLMPVKWDHSTSDLGQLSAGISPGVTKNYYLYDINSNSFTLKVNTSGITPLALTIGFETDGPNEIQDGDLLSTKFSQFSIELSLTLTLDATKQRVDLMSWATELKNLKFEGGADNGQYVGTFLGKPVSILGADLSAGVDKLVSTVLIVTLDTNKIGYIQNTIQQDIRQMLYSKLITPDPFSGETAQDQINSFFNSWLLGGMVEGEQGAVPGDNTCKVTNVQVDTSTSSLQIEYTGPKYTFEFDTPADWPAGHDFTQGALANIDHIVVLSMENRSFDHMLGYLSLPVESGGMGRTDVDGLKGNEFNMIGTQVCPSTPFLPGETIFAPDPPHSFDPVQKAINRDATGKGKMDGFAQSYADENGLPLGPTIMKYQPAANVPTYDALVRDFAVCQRWFACHPGPTFPNRYHEVSGRPNIDQQGFWELSNSSPKLPVFTRTIFDSLSDAGVSWNYFENYYCFLRFFQKYTFNTTNIFDFNDPTIGFPSVAGAGKLASVTFIDPHFIEFPPGGNCDGPPADIQRGQQLVEQVVQAVVASPNWSSTMLIVTYDEHGGFYDHVPPPPAAQVAPGLPATYGVRVPAFIISPWVTAGLVFGNDAESGSAGQKPSAYFDHTSILKTIAKRFLSANPPYMGPRFAAANDLSSLINAELRPNALLPFIPYNLLFSASQMFLEVEGGAATAGTLLCQATPNTTVAQDFSFEDAGGGNYYIRTHTGNLYLTADVPASGTSQPIGIKEDVKYAAGGSANPDTQLWGFIWYPTKVGSGVQIVTIHNKAVPGTTLHPAGQSTASGAAVVLEAVTETSLTDPSYQWVISSPLIPNTSGEAGPPVAAPVTFSPASLSFASQQINTRSGQQTVTITSGTSQFAISAIALLDPSGAASANFTCVPPPGSPPPAGSINIQNGQLVITVWFTPTAAGPLNATLQVSHNQAGSPLNIPLSGTGNPEPLPLLKFSPASLNFSPTAITNHTVTLENTGTAPLTIESIVIAGSSYSMTNTCNIGAGGGILQPGQQCTVNVVCRFTGPAGETDMVITHSAAGGRAVVELNATAKSGGGAQ